MVHPVNPQQRLVDKAVAVIRGGGLALVPTDAGYSLAWGLEARVPFMDNDLVELRLELEQKKGDRK